MTPTKALALVAGREISEALRRKSFWVAVVILFLGATAAMVIPTLLSSSGSATYDVAVAGNAPAVERAITDLQPVLDARVKVRTVADSAAAHRLVEDKDVDVGVVPGERPRIVVRSGENDRLVGGVRQALATNTISTRLNQAGLSKDQIAQAFDVAAPRVDKVDAGSEARRGAAAVVSIVIYLLLLTLMIQVANGVAIEKSNRISEVLLAIVRPSSLLFGKVIGVGIIGALTLAAGLVPIAVKLGFGGDLPNGIGGTLLASGAWFLLGLALYLTLAGGLGALVERQEEVGSVISPLTFILIGAFLLGQAAPDTTLGTVLAYVPLTSPIVVPARIAIGVSSPLELIVSVVILVLTIAAAARVGAVTYSRAIVRTGRRLKLREVMVSRGTAVSDLTP